MSVSLFRAIAILLLILLFDIGNLNALRQGTEGFYLQIAKETFELGSFLTPYHAGNPHWSKPPFQFWLTWPLFFIGGKTSLFLARSSIALLTFSLVLLISSFVKKYFKKDLAETILFFSATLALLKYGRIFMMEMPLALLSACSALLFYDFLASKSKLTFFVSALFLAFATLVKGPVALVMVVGSITLYFIISKRLKATAPIFFLWVLLAFSLSSLWFLASLVKYGSDFFNYFFLRENLGKFTSQSYPISSVIFGFLVYSLPWSLSLPSLVKSLFQKIDDLDLFLISCTLFSLILWMIPSQRSFHYAIPAIPYFTILIWRHLSIGKIAYSAFALLIVIATVVALFFALSFPMFSIPVLSISLSLFFSFLLLYSIIKERRIFLTTMPLALFCIWVLLIPSFILPLVPAKEVELVHGKKVGVLFRKPFFIEEAIGSPVTPIDTNPEFIIASELYPAPADYHPISSWSIWKRGIKVREVYEAMKSKEIAILEEKVTLYSK